MNKEKFPQKKHEDYMDFDCMVTSSSTDCTGLIPAAIQNDAEQDSYEELYRYLPPTPPKNIEKEK